MPIRTPLTELLGITHPILSAPMAFVSGGALAAAVSHAGGLGFVGGGYAERTFLDGELPHAGNARIGVGFITWSLLQRDPGLLDLALQHAPAAAWLSFGDASSLVDRVKRAGAKLVLQVQSVAMAREAASLGADVIVAQGSEAGGHGATRGTLPLVPAVVDAVAPLPVVAAGGVGDGRGLAAALMLGAAGVAVGTAFIAASESLAHPAAKRRLADSSGDQTQRDIVADVARRLDWPEGWTIRTLANDFTRRWAGDVAALRADERELERYDRARAAGDFDTAAVVAGEVADLVHAIEPAGAIVERIAAEAERLLAGAPVYLRSD